MNDIACEQAILEREYNEFPQTAALSSEEIQTRVAAVKKQLKAQRVLFHDGSSQSLNAAI
jgi:hypothetical protein